MKREFCPSVCSSLFVVFLLIGSLTGTGQVLAQTTASDGVIDVTMMPGATLGNRLFNCIQEFKSDIGTDFLRFSGGTCDAQAERGGVIGFRLVIDVPNLTIRFGSGTHELTGTGGLRVLAPGVRVVGTGTSTYFETSGRTANSPVFDVEGNVLARDLDGEPGDEDVPVFGVRLADFELEGTRTDTIDPNLPQLVRLRTVTDSNVENLILRQNDNAGIVIRDSEHIQVVRNTISGIYTNGVLVSGSSRHVDVALNTVTETGFAALAQSSFGSITVVGDPASLTAPSWVRVSENSVRNYGGAGVRVTRVDSAIPRHIQIVDNRIEAISAELVGMAGAGMLRDGEGIGVTGNHIQIIGNRIDRAYVNGIAVFSDDPSVVVEQIVISNNIVSNSSQLSGSENVHHAIALILSEGLARDLVISDNIGFDDQVTPTQNHTVSLNPGLRAPSEAVENLYVEGNISRNGLSVGPLHSNVVCVAAQGGNLPKPGESCTTS